MNDPTPKDPDYEARVRASFARQGLMVTLGASLIRVAPGLVEISLPTSNAVSQQHGFVHAGALASIAATHLIWPFSSRGPDVAHPGS